MRKRRCKRNQDPRLSIPSVSIPYGQRFITVTLAAANLLLQQLHAFDPSQDSPGTNTVPVPDVTTCELFINNIFVNPEIHDIFIKRIGFSLIRVHRQQTIRTNKAQDQLLLNQLKWPVETIYCGLRPISNIDPTSTAMLTDWDQYAQMTHESVALCGTHDYPVMSGGFTAAALTGVPTNLEISNKISSHSAGGVTLQSITAITGAVAGNSTTVAILNEWLGFYGFNLLNPADFANAAAPTVTELNVLWPSVGLSTTGGPVTVWGPVGQCQVTFEECTPTITDLSIQAHGVPLYNTIPQGFFNSYIPYTYGGTHIQTPADCGVYMIPFNLYPGSYQPSGHVNISRAREFYFLFNSHTIGSTVPQVDLVVVAIAKSIVSGNNALAKSL